MADPKCIPDVEGISLSDLRPGSLNDKIRQDAYDSFSIPGDNFMDVFMKIIKKTFGPNHTMVNSNFNGVCLQVLDPDETQKLVASGQPFEYYKKCAKASGAANLKACRVFIPTIHTDRALPNDIYNPSKKDLEKIKAFFPIFLAKTEDESNLSINPGDVLEVQIKNDLGGGVYLHRLQSKSTLNIFKPIDASSTPFKCAIIRFARITNQQGRTVTSGTTIVDEAPPKDSKLDEGTLKQQYIKYLYLKERHYAQALNLYWNDEERIKKFKTALKMALEDLKMDQLEDLAPSAIWVLMGAMGGYMSSGIANRGNITMQVENLNDHYGIFKATKKQYDGFIAELKVGGEGPAVRDQFLAKDHSDLLDPFFAIKFFLKDFERHLNKNDDGAKGWIVTKNLNDATNKKIILNYFTDDDKKSDYLFHNHVALTDDWNNSSGKFLAPAKFKDGLPTLTEFLKFQDWLYAATGGVGFGISSTEKSETGKSENSPHLKEKKPTTAKDECLNSPAPPKSSYLIHVDSQKKAIKKFIESGYSGDNLKFSSYKHVGVKNIIFGSMEVPCDFKIMRFDKGLNKQQHWFDIKNHKYAIYKEKYDSGYFRSKGQITHFTIHTLDGGSARHDFYSEILNILYARNKPPPHFLIAPNGQIIQLIDAAMATDNFLPNKETTINAAFMGGIGNKGGITSESDTISIKDHVLIKQDLKAKAYRSHKIGSSAAMQAMQKLIQFFMNITNIQYNLAAQDFKLLDKEINKSNIQAVGHYRGVGGMDFIYYAWTYGLAYKNNGKNILSMEEGYS